MCIGYELGIEPNPSDRSTSRDVYGNISSYFHVTQHHRALTVVSNSVVEVDPPGPEVYHAGAALAPWEAARPVGREAVLATEFTLDLSPPEITSAVREYAAPSFKRYRPSSTSSATSTPESSVTSPTARVDDRVDESGRRAQGGEGVCQDFARLAIACLRANGLAATYVSGYLATDPPPGKEHLFGYDATHAWAAVWTPQNLWLGMDPTNDQLVDERYVIVGWGRDYADVPPCAASSSPTPSTA